MARSPQVQPQPATETPELALEPDILGVLASDAVEAGALRERVGVVLTIFLASTSRLFKRPVGVLVRGTSSAGKSWTTGLALSFTPDAAVYSLTSMSPKALLYGTEPLEHRVLYVGEADGFGGEAASILRQLISEGRVNRETVESGPQGLVAKTVEREGPVSLITTSTSLGLEHETGTRILSIDLADGAEQVGNVLRVWAAAAAGSRAADVDRARWHELGRWLEGGPREVVVPFASAIAERMPTNATRVTRDFVNLLTLVQVHALLHRATRERDAEGRVVATLADYARVRDLLEPIIAVGLEAAVPRTVRETVEAVARLGEGQTGVSGRELVKALHVDKASVSRRVAAAIEGGWLRNLEDSPGRPQRLVLGEDLPLERAVLPTVDDLDDRWGSVAEAPA